MKKIKYFILLIASLCLITSCVKTSLTNLDTPVLVLEENTISWNEIENANGYTIFIDGIEEIDVDKDTTNYVLDITSVGLHKIRIKAKGDNTTYSDSSYSNSITYTIVSQTNKTKLATPVINVDSKGISWDIVKNATEYEIYVNDKLINTTSNVFYTLTSFKDEIKVKIKAVGNFNKYIDSDFSNVVSYNYNDYFMKISEIKEALDNSVTGKINVLFVGQVIGYDCLGFAHVADETGSIYVRHTCNELRLGYNVLIEGSAIIYRGTSRYPEYTRQVSSDGIKVSEYDKEITPIDFVDLSSDDLKNKNIDASFHGNPVLITGTVECGKDRYSFYINDGLGNHLVAIHHYSTNFNNNISDPNKNKFIDLNNKVVTVKGIIYRYYEADKIWTLQCVGFPNEIQEFSTRVPRPVVTKTDEKLDWQINSTIDVKYNIYVNGNLYKTTSETSFDLNSLGDGTFKIQVQAISTNNSYEPSLLSDAIVYIKNSTAQNVNIFMINDTHGSFVDTNYPGVERLSSLIKELTMLDGDYIKIMNGDCFQGSYVSNTLYGLPLVDALNLMEFDCFVIGNHEFDWGLDEIRKYKDGDTTNGEANFPFLGANIYDKATNKRVDWLDPYTIVEQNGIKVGIIGIIGHDLESSILTEYIEDYDFVYPLEIIKEYAKELRTIQKCNVVIVANHDYDEDLNRELASLSNEYLIDAILCGHTHQNEYDELIRSDKLSIASIENRDKNQSASSLILNLDENLNYESYTFKRYYPENYSLDSEMTMLLTKYQDVITEGNRVIGTTSQNLSRQTLGMYAVTKMKDEFNSDVAIINTGGVRATISRGEITVSSVFEVFPFNNKVITTTMKGSALRSLYNTNGSYLYFNKEFNVNNLVDNQDYKVAVIDYVYTNTRYTEFKNTIKVDTNYVMRDLLLEYLEELY